MQQQWNTSLLPFFFSLFFFSFFSFQSENVWWRSPRSRLLQHKRMNEHIRNQSLTMQRSVFKIEKRIMRIYKSRRWRGKKSNYVALQWKISPGHCIVSAHQKRETSFQRLSVLIVQLWNNWSHFLFFFQWVGVGKLSKHRVSQQN